MIPILWSSVVKRKAPVAFEGGAGAFCHPRQRGFEGWYFRNPGARKWFRLSSKINSPLGRDGA